MVVYRKWKHKLGFCLRSLGKKLMIDYGEERIWIDVGAHLGEKTFESAEANPLLKVYAFEPNFKIAFKRAGLLRNYITIPYAISEHDGCTEFYLNQMDAASSLYQFNQEGLKRWKSSENLKVVQKLTVPTIRLDTFMNSLGIVCVNYLKVDAQGSDLAVIRSAGNRIKDIKKITLEVQTTSHPLYEAAATKEQVIKFMTLAGFTLTNIEKQSLDQEENLTYERKIIK